MSGAGKIVFLLSVITCIESAKILAVIPTPLLSHQAVFRPLTQELARRGHQVTVITPIPAFPDGEALQNLTEIDVSNASLSLWQRKRSMNVLGYKYFTEGAKISLTMLVDIFESQIQHGEVQKLIGSNENFDLLLLEAWTCVPVAFSGVFKAPVIRISSLGSVLENDHLIGTPVHPIIFPKCFQYRTYNLTFWEKISKLYNALILSNVVDGVSRLADRMLERNIGPNFPNLDDLDDNIEMLFLNMHRIWEGNHPAPLSVVHMGGLHVKPPAELPEDLRSYLNSSKNGVIYISFGTNVMSTILIEKLVETIVDVVSQLPYNVLWKWDEDRLPGQSKNIRLVKWLPQADLLRHPKILLFITQAGLQSTDEAIAAGVPLIGIPMLADQWFNAENYIRHGIGVKLEMDVTEDQLRDAIVTVIGNDSYRRNILRVRSLMHDQPQPALQRAVQWVERVARHGAALPLRAPAAGLHTLCLLEFDLLAGLLLVTVIALVVLSLAVFYLITFIANNVFSYLSRRQTSKTCAPHGDNGVK